MSELTNLEKIRRLPWQIAGNGFNIIFWLTAAAGSVFILFLDELGLDKARIGLLLSLLPFCGISAVFTAPYVARFGLKRVFLIFFGVRKIFAAGLLLVPLVIKNFGMETGYLWVVCCVFGFAICRAISETAMYPWAQEMIPDNIRGKFSATSSIVNQLLAIATVAVSGYIIGHYQGINKYMFIIGGGIVAGVLAVYCFCYVPGGQAVRQSTANGTHFREMLSSLKDVNFRNFMLGLSLVTIGIGALAAFIPLYMKEQVGLSSMLVVWLDMGTYFGALLSSFIWGWAADRYGSKPIMLSGAVLMLPLPLLCFIMPRHSDASVEVALTITFILGISSTAWAIGMGRYLFVNAVPAQRKTAYMAVFYAGVGLVGGMAPLLAGYLLKSAASLDAAFLIFKIDAYTPLFMFSAFVLSAGIFVLNRTRSGGAMTTLKFFGLLLQGNPVLAVGSLFRYYHTPDENGRVSITQRLGLAKNRICNYELIEALNDPSYNVRYEAIIAVANSRPDPELIDALILVLGGDEPDLTLSAAWALGKMGDKSAVFALRETLLSEYTLLRARSARALATLGDTESISVLLDFFRKETDPGVRIAYAQSLGKMHCGEALTEMLPFLASLENNSLRSEMALALARIIGNEPHYISLWRQLKNDHDTATAMIILSLKSGLTNLNVNTVELKTMADNASAAFAHGHAEEGAFLLADLVAAISLTATSKPVAIILSECATRLKEFGAKRDEYILLALHAAKAAMNPNYTD
ncbi:MAG: MFS transporter [Sedimentisphaerales bacterium]|nr:MFS transporter [Sedimentisphaerales bacterium]